VTNLLLLEPDDNARWDAFVEAAPDGTFFHLSGWKRVIETAFRHRTYYLLAERDDAVTGVESVQVVEHVVTGRAADVANQHAVALGDIRARP